MWAGPVPMACLPLSSPTSSPFSSCVSFGAARIRGKKLYDTPQSYGVSPVHSYARDRVCDVLSHSVDGAHVLQVRGRCVFVSAAPGVRADVRKLPHCAPGFTLLRLPG